MQITWSEVPEYVVALQQENAARDYAFFLPTETIRGIEVLPFTPRHLIILDAVGSPFLCGGIPNEVEVARFLWAISKGYRSRPLPFVGHIRRTRFIRRLRKLPYAETVLAIHAYLDDAFADSPGSDGLPGAPSDYSLAAAIVHQLASEYGWTEEAILNTPFKRLWQYLRCIRRKHDPEARFINTRTQQAQRQHFEKLDGF